jgi:hypothetical protein
MKYLKDDFAHRDADGGEDLVTSTQLLEQRLTELEKKLAGLPPAALEERALTQIEMGQALVDLKRGMLAFDLGRAAFDTAIEYELWETAVIACEIMFQSEQDDALPALGQGLWLAVTFPVDPELTVALLQHVVDETPAESDGAAVAATVAHYISDVRGSGLARDNLMMFTNNMLATVARRHSKVTTQDQFSFWFNKLELSDPAKFLPRLRNVIDVMVQDNWWLDREAIRAKLPVQ